MTKRYGAAAVVDDVSFTIEAGSLVTLLGPSGCGKTTTLRMIAGLETPSEGQVLIGGRDVTAWAPAERNVSLVFQSYALFPHLSVLEASSSERSICSRVASPPRTPTGMFRKTRHSTMMSPVPVSSSGGTLKAST